MSNYDIYGQSTNQYYDEQPAILTNAYYSNMTYQPQSNFIPVYRTTTPGYEFPQNNIMYTGVNQYAIVNTNANVSDVVTDTVIEMNNTENNDATNSESTIISNKHKIFIIIFWLVLVGVGLIILRIYKK